MSEPPSRRTSTGLLVGIGAAIAAAAAITISLVVVLGGSDDADDAVRTLLHASYGGDCQQIDRVTHEAYRSTVHPVNSAQCEDRRQGADDDQIFVDITDLTESDAPEVLALDDTVDAPQTIVVAEYTLRYVAADGDPECARIVSESLVEQVAGEWLVRRDATVEVTEIAC